MWSGTLRDLAAEMGVRRQQLASTMRSLIATGLVDEVVPFGPNRAGTVFIAAFDELVVVNSRSTQITRRRELDPNWARNVGEVNANCSYPNIPASSDLGECERVRNKATKEEGTIPCLAHSIEWCMDCDVEAIVKNFDAHEIEKLEMGP